MEHVTEIRHERVGSGRRAFAFAAVGVVLAWSCQLIPPGSVARPVVHIATATATALAVGLGIRRNRPARMAAWYLILAGQCLQILGDVISRVVPALTEIRFGYPNPSDAFYMAGYCLYVTALPILGRARSERDRANLIDAAIVTTGVALLFWVMTIAPTVGDPSSSIAARATSSAYPMLDVLLISVLVRFGLASRRRTTSTRLLIAAAATTLVTDLSFAMLPSLQTTGLLDSGWLSAFVLLGTASLHPSMADEMKAKPAPLARLGNQRLILLALAALTAPVVLVAQSATGADIDALAIAVGAAVMFVLVVFRMEQLVGILGRAEAERRRLLERVMFVGERERTRMASAIHDSQIQRIASINLRLATLEQRIERGQKDTATAMLRDVQADLSDGIDGLRQLMMELRPPSLDHVGLQGALRDYAATVLAPYDVAYTIDVGATDALPTDVADAIFRIAREAIGNAATHSRCTSLTVTVLRTADGVELAVLDDGIGFDEQRRQTGFGLAGAIQDAEMHGGHVEIESARGRGTTLRASFAIRRDAA